jgi:photosystem II stability/assembly factor-like uncharacterized protein
MMHVSGTTGWIVGSKGFVLKTTDGGLTWNGAQNDSLGTLQSVYFRTATEGYIGSSSRKLYKTTDGGANWTRIMLTTVPDTGAVVRAIYFADASKGWILTTLSSATGVSSGPLMAVQRGPRSHRCRQQRHRHVLCSA